MDATKERKLRKRFCGLKRDVLLRVRAVYMYHASDDADDVIELIDEELDARARDEEDRANGIYPDGATVVEDDGRYDRNNPDSPWAY